jgi:hypothetical protein
VIIAAALCPAPPLLARELTGANPVLPELHHACLDAAAALLRSAPDVVAVVGVADQTRAWDPDAGLDLSVYAPALGAGRTGLPLPLGLGSRLLDQAGYAGRRELHSIGEHEQAEACAALGSRLAGAGLRVALLVMADGSARRGPKAPGYLDGRSAPFDAEVERAVRAGDMAALLALDAGLAQALMATGRPAWQVLAGAMKGQRPACVIRYRDDPFGVAYLVASLTVGPVGDDEQERT